VTTLAARDRLSRSELSRLTGLPKTTVTGLVKQLVRRGIVVETGTLARTAGRMGRPPAMLALAEPRGVIAAIVLTHGRLRAAAMGFGGSILALRAIDTDVPRLTDGVVGPAVRLMNDALAAAGLGPDALRMAVFGIPLPFRRGVGVAGLNEMSPALWRAMPDLPRLPEWLRRDPSAELQDALGVPAVTENDANLGALGEATFGAGRDARSLLYIKLVEGIGAGLIIEGRLYRGATEVAGELAHLRVRDDGPLCPCGNRGCVATLFGRPSLLALIQPAYERTLTFPDVIALAAHGDQGVWRMLGDLGHTLGRGIADFCVFANPDAIVLDGLLEAAGEPIVRGIRAAIDGRVLPVVAESVHVRVGSLGDDAELLGALAVARTRLLTGK
jgi:predicted NBD/HSP70 family sugar kinase